MTGTGKPSGIRTALLRRRTLTHRKRSIHLETRLNSRRVDTDKGFVQELQHQNTLFEPAAQSPLLRITRRKTWVADHRQRLLAPSISTSPSIKITPPIAPHRLLRQKCTRVRKGLVLDPRARVGIILIHHPSYHHPHIDYIGSSEQRRPRSRNHPRFSPIRGASRRSILCNDVSAIADIRPRS